jgi:hypothetical protein
MTPNPCMTDDCSSRAIIPLRILKQRTVAVCCIFSILYGIASMTYSMLLPTYFQTVHGATATMSGIYYMPMTIVSVVGIVITGFSITAWSHYVPFMWAGPLIFLPGSVLFYLLEPSSTRAEYLGYQVILGLGFGMAIHVSLIAVQVVSLPEDMPTACVTEMLCGQIGGAVGASIAQNLFVSTLRDELREIVSMEEAVAFANSGLEAMVESMKSLEVGLREQFRQALNDSVTTAFIVPIVVTALAEVVSWFIERRTIDVSKPEDSNSSSGSPQSPGDDIEASKEAGKTGIL